MEYLYYLVASLAFSAICYTGLMHLVILAAQYYLKTKLMLNLSINSIGLFSFKNIEIGCPFLATNLKIGHCSLSSKLITSRYNSLMVLKFSNIRLEGDIASAFAFLNNKKIFNAHAEQSSLLNIIFVRNIVGFIKSFICSLLDLTLSHLQISLHNTSLEQFGNPQDDSSLNASFFNSTIQLVQFEFVTRLKKQITFNVEGISIKILDPLESSQDCLLQMSFPLCFTYIIDDKSAIIQVSSLEVIANDILQLSSSFMHHKFNSVEPRPRRQQHSIEKILFWVRRLIDSSSINSVKFTLESCSLKLLNDSSQEMSLCIKPIEVSVIRLNNVMIECNIIMTNCQIQDSESAFYFVLTKCVIETKIEKIMDKLYLQVFLDVSSNSILVNSLLVHSWLQYFANVLKIFKLKQTSAIEANENDDRAVKKILADSVTKLGFVMEINDVSFTLKQSSDTLMTTYGLKHLKISCGRNFDILSQETSTELLLETLWCWNGNKNLKPLNPNSLKKCPEKQVPLFMSTLLLKFGKSNTSDVRVTCVMDGLQISIEYFVAQLENHKFDYLQADNLDEPAVESVESPSPPKYTILAQINLTSVNLLTSQIMLRVDSMASDLANSKMTCSINGFAINTMYAPSPVLVSLKASELLQHRIVYFSVVRISFSQDVNDISLTLTEEIFTQWSPSFHLIALELYQDIKRIYSNLYYIRSYSRTLKEYKSINTFNINLKMDGKISFGILLTDEGDCLHFKTEYFLASFMNCKYLTSKCEALSVYFNDVLNCQVEHLNIKHLNENQNPIDRKHFKLTQQAKNEALEINIHKISLMFPYQFNFAYYFNEKFITIVKWLRIRHGNGKVPAYLKEQSTGLARDFIIKIENILIEIADDPFEVKLHDNYELIQDEHNESQKRWNILIERLEEKRRKNVIISDSIYDECRKAAQKQNAEIYIKRSKKMHESNQPRTQLFVIEAKAFLLQLVCDPCYSGYDEKVALVQAIDPYSPLPEDLKFSTIWCKQMYCSIGECQVTLRDFPRPMVHAKKIQLKGVLLGAEQEASARAKRTCSIDMGTNFAKIQVERSMTTLKFYHDIRSKISSLIYTHGACWESILQQINLSFELIFRPSSDPSPTLTWWDKMRFLFHGNLNIDISEQISIVFHASFDPYNTTELIEFSFIDSNIHFVTGKISVLCDLDVFVHTASKYDECRIIHLPDMHITFDLNWDCSGNRNDHHSIMPCASDKLPEYTCNQIHDSYRAFRSHHLNLHLSLETREKSQECETQADWPSILLYNSTLRWLENKMFMFTGFPRLTRRGKLFGHMKPRKMPFSRLFKSIRLTIYFQMFEITYWSSFSRVRGFRITSSNFTHSAEHKQTFMKINDNLIHRPKPSWELIYMNSELSSVDIELYKAEAESINLNHLRNFFLKIQKVSYKRETNVPNDEEDEDKEPNPVHRLVIHDLKGAWTKDNREIVLSLFDSYMKTQLLKRNLSTEALRLFKDQINTSPAKNLGSQMLIEQNLYGLSKGNAANMLQKLISEVETSNNVVDTEHVENVVNDKVQLYGIEACQADDILLNNWLIELINSQVVLRGCETDGYVIMSAAKTQVTQRVHRPVWKNRILYSKTTWQGSLECMQYYATVNAGGLRIDDITWLDLDDIEERNVRDIVEIPDLVGSGRSVGGVVNSEAGGSTHSNESNETNQVPIQLQRIVSRCRCQFFYASYAENADPDHTIVPPLPQDDDLLPLGPWDKQVAVDTFTLTHEHLEISTNSQQFAMIVDLVNNLLLYIEPHKKEVYEQQQRIRFSMQLNSLEDQREPISDLQDKVRLLLNKIKTLEKDSYSKFKQVLENNEVAREDYAANEKRLAECKDELSVASEELSIMINCYKEAQLIALKTKERQVAAQESRGSLMAQAIRRNEVCFKQASWRLTDSDGQLGLADIVLNNFLYTKVSKNDDSVEHSFELGYIHVRNMLPNQVYRDVLQPTELQPNMPVDQHRALRILCIERAPVGGIAVKEHLELNVIPLTLGITHAFFRKMLKFFFPNRSNETSTAASANTSSCNTLSDTVPTADSEDYASKGKKKSALLKKDESTMNLTNYNKNFAKDIHHIEKMRERASKNQTFVYIKIPEVPINISYKGNKNKNLEDLHDVMLMLPTIEYHNRTWTWLDLLMALKNDSKRELLSQALKHKFHISKSKPDKGHELDKKSNQALQSQSSEDEHKARILLGKIVVPQKSKTKSILMFGNKK